MVASLCGIGSQHKRENKKKKSVQLGGHEKTLISSTKDLLMAKMICWRKVEDKDDENALWKRTIIKGGKCKPLEFSGKICYDDKGNPIMD